MFFLLSLMLFGPGAAAAATPPRDAPVCLRAESLLDYIRGNRSRMIQVTTIAFGIGLVILMTATRKR